MGESRDSESTDGEDGSVLHLDDWELRCECGEVVIEKMFVDVDERGCVWKTRRRGRAGVFIFELGKSETRRSLKSGWARLAFLSAI